MKQVFLLTLLLSVWSTSCRQTNIDTATQKPVTVLVPDTTALEVPDIHLPLNGIDFVRKNGLLFYKGKPYSGYAGERLEDGTLLGTTGYVDGKREGIALKYYKDGSLRERRDYRRNRKHGHHEGWWPDGTPKFDYHFVAGVAEGTHRTWFQNGQPLQLLTYLHGKENGPQKLWKPDGGIRGNYVVKDGRRYGLIGLKNCKSVKYDNEDYQTIAY